MYSVIASDGKTYGPVDVPTLRLWCAEGRVTPNTNIIDAVSGRTMRAVDLQDLFDVFPQPNPTPPTPSMGAPTAYPPQPGIRDPYMGSAGAFGQPTAQPGGYGQMQSPYGGGAYSQSPSPFMRAPSYGPTVGQKSKVAAALLAFFLGFLGIHRFYLGYTGIGVAMVILFVITGGIVSGIWALVDFVLILCGSLKDAQGYDLA